MALVGRLLGASIAIACAACTTSTSRGGDGTAVVVAVIDGDTIDVSIAGRTERVRLLGIDTPEIAHEAFGGRPANEAECLGDVASELTTRLVPAGTVVRLERDVVGRDDYGRLLAFVYRSSDGLFVNEYLVRSGVAVPLSIPPNESLRSVFADAARAAERDDIGIWSMC